MSKKTMGIPNAAWSRFWLYFAFLVGVMAVTILLRMLTYLAYEIEGADIDFYRSLDISFDVLIFGGGILVANAIHNRSLRYIIGGCVLFLLWLVVILAHFLLNRYTGWSDLSIFLTASGISLIGYVAISLPIAWVIEIEKQRSVADDGRLVRWWKSFTGK